MDSVNFVLVLVIICLAAIAFEVLLATLKKQNFSFLFAHKSTFVMAGSALCVLSLLIINYGQFSKNSQKALQASVIELEESSPKNAQADFLQQKIYKNEVFGSTVNKVLISTIFYFDDQSENPA